MLGLRHLPLKFRLPLIHGALAWLGRRRRRRWLKPEAAAPQAGDFVVSGFFSETLGVGRGGQLSADAFQAAGFDIVRHDLRPAFKKLLSGRARLPGQGGVWFLHANAPECLVAFLAHDPKSWAQRYRIGYWAWETPRAPDDWVWLADYLHEIWVPSRFAGDAVIAAFAAAGREDLNDRVRVMPHPLPLRPPLCYDYAHQRFGMTPELCEVLSLFDVKSSPARKNPWAVLDVWKRAFPLPSDTARLTLKISDLSKDAKTARRLLRELKGRPDIRLFEERLSAADMDAFIAGFDVLMSLHRAEGFGLPLAEAMAAEVAVIATGWSGNLDFMTETNSRLIPVRLVPLRDPDGPYCRETGKPGQVWADPDPIAATDALLELTRSEGLRRDLVFAARQSVRALSALWRREALDALPFRAFLPDVRPQTTPSPGATRTRRR
jgi:glycosyltransferase involved in cell wall biosynthesis